MTTPHASSGTAAVAPRHRHTVDHGTLVVGHKVFRCALPLASGIRVLAERDPQDIGRLFVYTLSGLFVCFADLESAARQEQP